MPDVDLDDDESPSSNATTPQNCEDENGDDCDGDDGGDEADGKVEANSQMMAKKKSNTVIDCQSSPTKTQQVLQTISTISSSSSAEDDDLGDGLRKLGCGGLQDDCLQQQMVRAAVVPPLNPTGRRRRKLPEIPKNKKCE